MGSISLGKLIILKFSCNIKCWVENGEKCVKIIQLEDVVKYLVKTKKNTL